MKAAGAVLCLLVLAAPAAQANPIQKVISMLSDLQAKIIKEGDDAQKVYEEFAEWCEDRARELQWQIKGVKAEVNEAKACIVAQAESCDSAQANLEECTGALKTDEADLKAATEIRAKEQVDFAAEEKELVEVVDTITRAKGILEREMAKSGSASMLQLRNAGTVADALKVMVQASVISSTDASKLTALVQSAQQQHGERAKDASHLLQSAKVQKPPGLQGDAVQGRQGLARRAGEAAVRQQAGGLRRADQARLPQEGEDDQEDHAAPDLH